MGKAGSALGAAWWLIITLALAPSILSFLSYKPKNWLGKQLPLQEQLFATETENNEPKARIRIALTREKDANINLGRLLYDYDCVQLPCLTFMASNMQKTKLAELMPSADVIVITSPQSAKVFLDSWEMANNPKVNIASIGTATSKVLFQRGIDISFQPTMPSGAALAEQLPLSLGTKVLYPCSKLADDAIETKLTSRGFQLQRLNTYTTKSKPWSKKEYEKSKNIDLVTFASPSAVRVWAERMGTQIPAVVIGQTTKGAAEHAGFRNVFSTVYQVEDIVHDPVGAWATAVHQAIKTLEARKEAKLAAQAEANKPDIIMKHTLVVSEPVIEDESGRWMMYNPDYQDTANMLTKTDDKPQT